ncbi:hypothetical protein EBU94_05235 [bacterium]|nr:hypothetical protein [bacterium]
MRVFTIYETTQIRDNNYVNNGFFINNIFTRVYGKNQLIGKIIKVVDDYWYSRDKSNGLGVSKDALNVVTQDPIIHESVNQVNDSILNMSKTKSRKYYKWYLVELDSSLGYGNSRKYVRSDVVRVSK